MKNQKIEMYCICDISRNDEYIMYDPYYDAWHAPYRMDSYITSSSLMKSDIEALQILKKLYMNESNDYKIKIEAKQIVIKKVSLLLMKNLLDCENYEINPDKKEWVDKRTEKVNFTEFSGNALNYICKDNPEYHKLNWDKDFDISDIFK